MPYVEVWVDERDCNCNCGCDGHCESGKKLALLEDMVNAARIAILECRWDDVDAILRGEKYVEPRPSISKIEQTYERWKNGKLKGFAAEGQP